MKMTPFVAAIILSGATFAYENVAIAKSPLEMEGAQSSLALAKNEVQHTNIEFKDFPFGLEEGRIENPRMVFTQEIKNPESDDIATGSYTITMPWLDVSKDGDDKVTVTYPPTIKLRLNVTGPTGETDFDIDMISKETVLDFVRDGDRMNFSGASDAFGASVKIPNEIAEEEGVDGEFSFVGNNLVVKGNGVAEQDFEDLQSLDIEYTYTVESTAFDIRMEASEAFSMSGTSGESGFDGKIGDGIFRSGMSLNNTEINVESPTPIKASVGRMETFSEGPTDASPEPQDFHYKFALSDIEIDETLWAMMDPEGVFPRELNKMTIDIGMKAMMFVSFLDPDALTKSAESNLPPMMPTDVSINSIAFDGLGLVIDMEGAGELGNEGPQASGNLSIKGLADFVQNAQALGAFGEQESMMIQGMAQQFGKEGEDGALIFELKTKDGMILVNDTPVAPLPD